MVPLTRTLAILLLVVFQGPSTFAQVAPSSAGRQGTIVSGHARFQFLTPSLVRMEYAPGGSFVDAPSAVVLNRTWSPVEVKVSSENGWLVARSSVLTLRYLAGSAALSALTLRVSWTDAARDRSWSPGTTDSENLGGISHSLDGAREGRFPAFEPGILSRAGYFVLDDSHTPVWDSASQWIRPRSDTGYQDLYLFVYGRKYARALKDYAALCGSIPMVPRYVLGGWITDLNYEYLPGTEMIEKYHPTDRELRNIVERFRTEHIPLDVLVLDFAWHRYGWQGGYDWSPIFHDPTEFLRWAHSRGLRVSANDHPGYGGESTLSDSDSHAARIRQLLRLEPPRPSQFAVDLQSGWKFRTDPGDTGIRDQWASEKFSDDSWKTLEGGRSWEDQGFPDYDGIGWYRKWVDVPASAPAGPLYLVFGGVDDEYDLYVNGTKVAHHGSRGNSVYGTATWTDVAATIRRGAKNLVVLRVNDWGGEGGITKTPVMLADEPPAQGIRFNLADRAQARAFMDILHNPLIDQGIDFWWIDGGSGSCRMEGLNSQMWSNKVFYDFTQAHTGTRTFVFSRYGGWGDHRVPGYFTGDTHSEWGVLAYEVPFTARGGNVLVPYMTHDIGGFLGKKLDFDLYARWLEFGVFSPILRLHSAHENPDEGNLRLPWIYGQKGIDLARELFRLRYRLIPYIYTYCRVAHDEALSLVRPLYLEHPDLAAAYDHPDEYYFGKEFLVAPIVTDTNERGVYLPPGSWVDYFSGKKHSGGQTIRVECPVNRIPVFVRSGSIVPQRTDVAWTDERPMDTVIVDVYGPEAGSFRLYEDDGSSLDYLSGKSAWTPMTFSGGERDGYRFTIGPAEGTFSGQVQSRSEVVRLHGLRKPSSVALSIGSGSPTSPRWTWDESSGVVTVLVPSSPTSSGLSLLIR